jgi:hypothetical protein
MFFARKKALYNNTTEVIFVVKDFPRTLDALVTKELKSYPYEATTKSPLLEPKK